MRYVPFVYATNAPLPSALPELPETQEGTEQTLDPQAQETKNNYSTAGRTITLTKPLRVENIARGFIPSIPDVTFTYDIAYDANTGENKDVIQVDSSGYILDDIDSRFTPVAKGVDEFGTAFDIWRGPFGGITVSPVTFSHEDSFDNGSNDTVTKRIEVQIAGGEGASSQLFPRPGVYRYPIVETGMREVNLGEADETAANVTGNNESGLNIEDVESDITFNRSIGVNSYGTATVSVVTTDPLDEFSEPYIARIYQENANDNDYTLFEELTLTKLKGAPLDDAMLKSVFAKDRYPGFHLNGTGANPNNNVFKDDRAPFVVGSEHGIPVVEVYYSRNTYTLSFRFDQNIATNLDTIDGIQGGTKLNNTHYNKAVRDVGYGDLFGTKTYVKYGQNMFENVYSQGPSSEKIRAFMDGGRYGWSFWATWLGNSWQTVFNSGNPRLTFNPGSKPDGSQVVALIKNNTRIFNYTVIHHFDDGSTVEWSAYYDEFHTQRFTTGSVSYFPGYKLIRVENYNTGFDKTQGRQEDPKLYGESEWQYYFKGTTWQGFEPLHVYYEKLPEDEGNNPFRIDGSGTEIVVGDEAAMELRFLDVYVEWNEFEDGYVIKDVVLHDIADDVTFDAYGNYAIGSEGTPASDDVFGKKEGFSESVYTTYDLVIGKELMGKGLTKYDIWDREYKYDVIMHGPAHMEIGNVRKMFQGNTYADAGRLTFGADGTLHTQIEVHHGEYVILSGLPSGVTYEIEEINNEKDARNSQPETLDVFGEMIYHTAELSDII
ncbi:MAG: hypothetical protein IJR58_04680, partial [Lachnospiraceae bacterium]|nr:hypothetical protein [Lachnospiraceae bacterium]